MKLKLKATLVATIVICSIATVMAQKGKIDEGKIVFSMSYPGATLDPQMAAMMPTESTIYFKKEQSRTEVKMGMGMTTTVLANSKTNASTVLMDMMGNKIAMKMTAEDLAKEAAKSGKSTVKELTETKEIAGFKCKKVEITTAKGDKIYAFVTKDITAKMGGRNEIKGVEGFPMEFEYKQNGITMKMTAKSVSAEKVDDSKFAVPVGYKETTKEEMQKMFGGMSGM
jgi:GLPGLI family protein